MNIGRTISLTIVVGLLAFASHMTQARIYKTVDEDGNVVFTDVPPKDQAETIEIGRPSTYAPPEAPQRPTRRSRQVGEEDPDELEVVAYNRIAITSPSDDESVRENAGNVTIIVNTNPEIDVGQGHLVRVLLNGQPQGTSTDGIVQLANVDRGTHVVTAQIIDRDGQPLLASAPITFHMLRYSALQRRPSAN